MDDLHLQIKSWANNIKIKKSKNTSDLQPLLAIPIAPQDVESKDIPPIG